MMDGTNINVNMEHLIAALQKFQAWQSEWTDIQEHRGQRDTADQLMKLMGIPSDHISCLIGGSDAPIFRKAADEIAALRERVEAMNAVFGEIRIAVGSNGCSNYDTPEEPDPDAPWLPCGLVVKIGDVMEKEYRR